MLLYQVGSRSVVHVAMVLQIEGWNSWQHGPMEGRVLELLETAAPRYALHVVICDNEPRIS